MKFDFESNLKFDPADKLGELLCDHCVKVNECCYCYGTETCKTYKEAEKLLNEQIFDKPEKQSKKPEFRDINIMLDVIIDRLNGLDKSIELLMCNVFVEYDIKRREVIQVDENKDNVKGMQPIYLNVKIATGTTVEEYERNLSKVAAALPTAPGKWQFSQSSHKGELVGTFVDVDAT